MGGFSVLSLLLSVLNERPELVPVEGAGEFSVVALHTISGSKGSEFKGWNGSAVPCFHVFTARAVTGFAAHIGEAISSEAPTIP